jgi:hypothetical protein
MFCSGACQLARATWRNERRGCPTCHDMNPPDGFAANGFCRSCDRAMRQRYRSPEDRRISRRTQSNRRLLDLRRVVLSAYGGRCACCGEDRYAFLAIDHVHGGGTREREDGVRGESLYKQLRERGYPPEYRLLCHNCNGARGWRGGCPHDNSCILR